MFHNIGDKKYHCEYKPREPNFENDYLLSFRDDKVLLSKNTIPHLKEVWPAGGTSSVRFLFSISDTACNA